MVIIMASHECEGVQERDELEIFTIGYDWVLSSGPRMIQDIDYCPLCGADLTEIFKELI